MDIGDDMDDFEQFEHMDNGYPYGLNGYNYEFEEKKLLKIAELLKLPLKYVKMNEQKKKIRDYIWKKWLPLAKHSNRQLQTQQSNELLLINSNNNNNCNENNNNNNEIFNENNNYELQKWNEIIINNENNNENNNKRIKINVKSKNIITTKKLIIIPTFFQFEDNNDNDNEMIC